MKKTIRLVTLFLAALALVVSASALPAAAAPGNTFPGGSSNIDNQTHSIAANGALWYSFDYAGDRSMITLTLVNGTKSGVGFDIFTPGQIGDWWDVSPIGRGTPQALNCSSGLPQDGGACQANDLTWVGNFPGSGTYYVEVVNNDASAMNFQLTIAGSGVTMTPQTVAASTSVSQPAATGATTTTGNAAVKIAGGSNIDPGHAIIMDNYSHTIGASSSFWYKFDYVANHTNVTITMSNGRNGGLGFNVFTSSQLWDWWSETPIGRGTGQAVNCTGTSPGVFGACQSNDLSWNGNFNTNGTYYVQVFNNNDSAATWQLMIQGAGVALQ